MSELKLCPFCGGEAEMLTAESMNGGYLFGIMCNDCRSRGDVYDTEAEAIEAWNTRGNGRSLRGRALRLMERGAGLLGEERVVLMRELKLCPFCGGEPDEYEGDYGNGIYCMKCGAMVGEPIHLGFNIAERVSYGQAIEAWNTRAERTCHRVDVNGYSFRFECSLCGYVAIVHNCEIRLDELPNYCPNCGAKVVSE